MDVEEFRVRGKEMVDYICTYMTTLKTRRVTPSVEPGYLRAELPAEAPFHPECWDDVMKDVENKIMPGVTHWQHPRFHAYFPSGNAYPSILGDMLSAGIGCVGFSWVRDNLKALYIIQNFKNIISSVKFFKFLLLQSTAIVELFREFMCRYQIEVFIPALGLVN